MLTIQSSYDYAIMEVGLNEIEEKGAKKYPPNQATVVVMGLDNVITHYKE